MYKKISFIFLIILFSILFGRTVNASSIEYISDKNELLEKIAEIESGEEKTIYIDRIEYSGPILFNIEDKNITIEGKDASSGFINNTLGCIMLQATSENEKSGTITFKNISFKTELDDYNEEDTYSSSMLYGIKVDAGNINVNIDNCLFDGFRYGKGSGGAIQVIYSVSSNTNCKANMNITNSKFIDNVSISGSAIYASGSENINLYVNNCEFSDNHSVRGAIFVLGTNTFIKDTNFNNNGDYKECDSDYTRIGSAIASISSTISLINSTIQNNNGSSIIYLDKCKGYFANNTIQNNTSKETCLMVKNSATKVVLFFNNLFDSNTNTNERDFSCDKSESNFETETRTKFYFNTFNNIGTNHDINNDHVYSFGNLFINPSVTSSTLPSVVNNYNTVLSNINEVDSNLNNMIIPNDIIKENLTLFETYIGTFYSKQTEFTKDLNVDGETISIDSLTHKEKYGFDFENYYYNGKVLTNNKTLISKVGNNNIDLKYNINTKGVLLFIVAPIILIILIALFIIIRFVLKNNNEIVIDEAKTSENNELKDVQEIDELNNTNKNTSINEEIISSLSSREVEVLNLLLEGIDRKEIADKLFVSESTIKKHIASIYSKLDVKNRIELFLKVKK